MAKRNDMSAARRSRNRKQEPVSEPATPTVRASGDALPAEPASPSNPADLSEIVSEERTRLLKAQAVLGCLAFALLYEDWLEPPHRPSFADAVGPRLKTSSMGPLIGLAAVDSPKPDGDGARR